MEPLRHEGMRTLGVLILFHVHDYGSLRQKWGNPELALMMHMNSSWMYSGNGG